MQASKMKKSLLTVILSMLMCFSVAIGCLSLTQSAKAETSPVSTFETVEGAWVRTHAEKERLGIRFQIRMESSEYKTFMENYSDVEFGMFVIPEDYRTSKGDFDEENLFTAPIYYWGEVEES